MNQTYEKLLSPGKIGSLELKNRAVFPPMGTNYCNEGVVNDRIIHYHAARAKGGCGLNIVEICPVHYTSQTGLNPNIYSDDAIPAFAKLAKAIHDNGGKACLQLWHGGRQTSGKPFNGKPWAPSATTCAFSLQHSSVGCCGLSFRLFFIPPSGLMPQCLPYLLFLRPSQP